MNFGEDIYSLVNKARLYNLTYDQILQVIAMDELFNLKFLNNDGDNIEYACKFIKKVELDFNSYLIDIKDSMDYLDYLTREILLEGISLKREDLKNAIERVNKKEIK